MPPTPHPEPTTPDMDMDLDMAKTPQPRPMAELDQTRLQRAAVRDPESYLISPLPQFTGRLPDAVALPDEDEPRDKLKAKSVATKSPRQEESQLAFQSFALPPTPPTPSPRKCDAAGHPYTCDCEEFAIFNEDVKKPGSRRPSFADPVSTPAIEAHIKVPPPTPSGESYPTPMSPGRARSHTIPTHTSRPPSRAPSPKLRPSGSSRVISSPLSNHSSLQSGGTESLKSRLHDLLQDNAGMSSSLPNMSSSHFPASLTRETPQLTQKAELSSRPPSRSGATPLQHRVNPLLSPKQGDSERVRNSPQVAASSMAPATPSAPPVPPAPVFSRASNAAMAIEKERKEKKEQERERRRLEKEKKRATEQEAPARSNSASNSSDVTASTTSISSTSYGRPHASSGRDSTGPHTSQRHTSTSSSHSSASMIPSSVYT